MGQKVNPIGLRLGIVGTWSSVWYGNKKSYSTKLLEDIAIRKMVKSKLKTFGVSKIVIHRASSKVMVFIHTAQPGKIVGKKGDMISSIKQEVSKITASEVSINIMEEKKPEVNAQLVAESVCEQLEKRISFRKAAKRAVQNAMKMGAIGIRVNVAGRLGGAEIARTEWYREGRVPLHTLKENIGYGFAEAHTTYGVIGVKVWICNPLNKQVDHKKDVKNVNS